MAGKTAKKTATTAAPGRPFVAGPDARRGHGLRGRSGRKPDAFKALCRELVSSPETLAAASAILTDPTHPAWPGTFKALAAYGYGAPSHTVALSGALDLTLAAASARAKLARLAMTLAPVTP
jgi:hypothetical protein